MASAVYKNLEQLLKISNQVECHESGMSRSNSKKSYVDVQTLQCNDELSKSHSAQSRIQCHVPIATTGEVLQTHRQLLANSTYAT